MVSKIFTVFMLFTVIVVMSGAADAEPNLTRILNATYGQGNYVEQAGSEFWFSPGSYVATTLNVTAHMAGYTDPTGWYDRNTGALHQVFDTPERGERSYINPSVPFGIYINSSLRINVITIFKTEKSKNPDLKKHARVFKVNKVRGVPVTMPTWAIGFEDLSLGDADYQDVVLELRGADMGIPEFPTIALPVAATLGLVFIFRHRKNRRE